MSLALIGAALLFLFAIAVSALWIFTPTWQCPVCHSYHVKDQDETLSCESCKHTWRAV